MVEKESRRCIKVLRSDRGGEFCSHEFNSLCSEAGIKRELTAPYTPQHNGVVERKNRTIMGLARSMLFKKQLPKCFWAEAVSTAVYTMNRSPTKALVKQTPLHAWSGIKPTVGHMKAFGCIAYGLNLAHKSKLDQRSEKQIFIGYTSTVKSTSDVEFLENQKWEWSSEGTSNVQDTSDSDNSFDNLFGDPFPTNDTFTTSNKPTPSTDPQPTQSAPPSPQDIPPLTQNTSNHSPEPNPTNGPHHTEAGPSKRVSKPPTWLKEYYTGEELSDDDLHTTCQFALHTADPASYKEACNNDKWLQAMKEEIASIEKNDPWQLVLPLPRQKYCGCQMVIQD
ncbi:uncharacterized protein LOC143578759 [Bidens hawaiensis]|uniref:uncharacterized protein LOC143578759 n=1 Tax=Bidens hawaiensis TaxID=980011 RepID=UPI004049F81B